MEHGLDPRVRGLLADQHRDPRLVEDMAEALIGMCRIERHIGRTRLEAGEQCDDRPFRAVEADSDDPAGTDTKGAQMMGQTVRRRLEGGVAEVPRAADERDIGAGCIDAGLEQFVQTAGGRGVTRCPAGSAWPVRRHGKRMFRGQHDMAPAPVTGGGERSACSSSYVTFPGTGESRERTKYARRSRRRCTLEMRPAVGMKRRSQRRSSERQPWG